VRLDYVPLVSRFAKVTSRPATASASAANVALVFRRYNG
jgi:hypothetical protein